MILHIKHTKISNMKKKNVIIVMLVCCCLILGIAGSIFGLKHYRNKKEIDDRKINIGFYELNQSQQQIFTQIVQDICSQNELTVNFYTIEKEQDYPKEIKDKKINLILTPAGFAVQKAVDAAAKDVSIPADTTSGMFTSMRQAVIQNDGAIKAIPLIFDNLEINIEISAFKMSGLERIATWEDIEKFAQIEIAREEIDSPISFAGAEPAFLLDLLGALGEAFDGYDAYNQAAQILKDAVDAKKTGQDFNASAVAKKIFIDPDAPLPYSMYYLKQLVKKGYITTASKQLIHTDINSYIQQRVTKAFFTSLSVHRTYDVKAVSRFSTIYFPSKSAANQRHFTATITYAVPLTTNANLSVLIEELLSAQAQETLSQQTGLAPVLANCRTPDQQADDARYWVAATNPPVAGLSREAELSDAELKSLGDEVRALVFY